MKEKVVKYVLEFVVIVVGISLSFYVEKVNEQQYRESLKNQSLKRILENIKVDAQDFQFNLKANKRAVHSSNWIIRNRNNIKNLAADSVGFHLNRAIVYNTIFVDNQEEYRGLQNSGLIELIENEDLVLRLQKKYIIHEFMKSLEKEIIKNSERFKAYNFNNMKFKSDRTDDLGLLFDRTYTSKQTIPNRIIEMLFEKRFLHSFYLERIENRIEADQAIVEDIKKELQIH